MQRFHGVEFLESETQECGAKGVHHFVNHQVALFVS